MRDARWGVFMHFLAERPDIPADQWNRGIDGFDVHALATQLSSVHAGYFFITLGQNSGHYLAPNSAYDRLTGIRPGKCAQRDLVADLHGALSNRGIRLLVYLPSGAPDQDEAAMKKLEWAKGPNRNASFQRRWEEVIAEWSVRWGRKVSGWWFDGCYWPNSMYRFGDPPNYRTFAAAARKGNSNAALAFNRGVVTPIHSDSEEDDYTAGEIDDPRQVQPGEFWNDRAQPHMLSFLGKSWSAGAPRFAGAEAIAITRRLVEKGMAVTWDVPHDPSGRIAEPFYRQLKAIGADLARTR
jgi:Alpha-L-fucosidase